MRSDAWEGTASLTLELSSDRPRELVFNDIQQAVDSVTTLPGDAEEPNVQFNVWRRAVLDIQLYGDASDYAMRMAAEA